MKKRITAGILAGLLILPSISFTANAMSASSALNNKSEIQKQNFEITKDEAIEDINYVSNIIKEHHVSAVQKLPDAVETQKEIEIKELNKKDKISVTDEWKIISRILSKLQDAHTSILPPDCLNEKGLPFSTKYENSNLICTSGDYSNYEIADINGISIDDLYKNFKNHFSYEIEEWAEYNLFENPYGYIPEWKLALCGIDTSNPVRVRFKYGHKLISKKFELTEIKNSNTNSQDWVSYTINENKSLGIFTLNKCENNNELLQKLKDFLKEVSDKKIKNIAIDLRENSGGDSSVAALFATIFSNCPELKICDVDIRTNNTISEKRNDTINTKICKSTVFHNLPQNLFFEGRVFLLTSHKTFSSAMLFAELFSDNNLATIVGETPGNSPEHYGEVTPYFELPNSKLKFQTTSKKFYRIDKTKDSKKLIPDVQTSAKDALDKVYDIISENNVLQIKEKVHKIQENANNYFDKANQLFKKNYKYNSKEVQNLLKEYEESMREICPDFSIKNSYEITEKLNQQNPEFKKSSEESEKKRREVINSIYGKNSYEFFDQAFKYYAGITK